MTAANLSLLAHFMAHPLEWATITPLSIIVAAILVILVSFSLFRSSSNEKVYDLGGIPIITAWSFFTRRYDFVREGFKESGGKIFRFRVLQHRVVSLAGESSRKAFFSQPGLSPVEGYRILMGAAPELKDIDTETTSEGEDTQTQSEVDDSFVKRLQSLVRRERIADTLPILLADLNNRILDWGNDGKINPFKEVYDLVFQMTVRMATYKELADDREAVQELTKDYWTLEKSATPFSLLLPWFPGPAKKAKERSTTALYNLFLRFVELRREATTPSTDPIDLLITQGHSNQTIIDDNGHYFCWRSQYRHGWTLIHLGSTPSWKQRAIDEYKALVANHSNTISSDPLHKRLSVIPLNAWEDELPSLDFIIRETLRMTMTGSALRRNMHEDLVMDDVIIKQGDFLTYQIADIHMNPNIYTEPTKFDPERYLEGREEDHKETFASMGWGVGRHPCSGMKIAKLEIKLVLALILLGFEYELVDGSGEYPKSLPEPDRNDIQQARPLGEPCFLKFKRIVD